MKENFTKWSICDINHFQLEVGLGVAVISKNKYPYLIRGKIVSIEYKTKTAKIHIKDLDDSDFNNDLYGCYKHERIIEAVYKDNINCYITDKCMGMNVKYVV